jgi:hypothetical protein
MINITSNITMRTGFKHSLVVEDVTVLFVSLESKALRGVACGYSTIEELIGTWNTTFLVPTLEFCTRCSLVRARRTEEQALKSRLLCLCLEIGLTGGEKEVFVIIDG